MIIVNPQSQARVEFIGVDKTPIIIIDDYAQNHDEIIEQVVKNSCFNPDEITSYPGVRSPIPKGLVVGYLKPLIEGLYKVYKIPERLQPSPKDNYFSLISTPAEELSPIQSWPHFDTHNPNLLAVIHYLGKGQHGGIGFFKHKRSGLERIEEQNKAYFYQCADEYFESGANQNVAYCQEQHSEFTCYKKIAYKPNRLIIFPGQLLHSALVDLDRDLNIDPASGRLTANMFVVFK